MTAESIETLQEDFQRVAERCPKGALVTTSEIASYLAQDLIPFVGGVVSEIADQDECIESLVTEAEDVLHTENASVFASIIAMGKAIGEELRKRCDRDAAVLKLLAEWNQLLEQGTGVIEDIAIPDDQDEDEDPEDDDEPTKEAK